MARYCGTVVRGFESGSDSGKKKKMEKENGKNGKNKKGIKQHKSKLHYPRTRNFATVDAIGIFFFRLDLL